MGRGMRQVLSEMLVPFKAVVQLGGVKGVMMQVEVSSPICSSGLTYRLPGHTANWTMCPVMSILCSMAHWMNGVMMVYIPNSLYLQTDHYGLCRIRDWRRHWYA
jgi:hypothetical protein